MVGEALLHVEDLVVDYAARGLLRTTHRAVDGVTLGVQEGRTLGVVGESGSGKSTVARAVLGLAPVASGRITFDGADISRLRRRERRHLARRLQVVFQDPYSSLNPAMTVGSVLAEPLQQQGVSGPDARQRIQEMLDVVALPGDAHRRLPREFSGGQRQRVAIARALVLQPELIICDEAVSALDLVNQARVLDLLLEIQQRTGVAYVFISHDLDVVRHLSHDIVVLREGRIVERGSTVDVTSTPQHPYTQQLLLAAPVPDVQEQRRRRDQRSRLMSSNQRPEALR